MSSRERTDLSPKTNDYKAFIDQLCSAKLVISSSLHGIILAEAYGIPAILLKDDAVHCLFKYEDYYFGTGRTDIPIAQTVEDAIKMPLPVIPDLQKNQEMLLESFPIDLWK